MMSIILYPWLIENRFLHNYNLGVIFVLWGREKSYQQFKKYYWYKMKSWFKSKIKYFCRFYKIYYSKDGNSNHGGLEFFSRNVAKSTVSMYIVYSYAVVMDKV